MTCRRRTLRSLLAAPLAYMAGSLPLKALTPKAEPKPARRGHVINIRRRLVPGIKSDVKPNYYGEDAEGNVEIMSGTVHFMHSDDLNALLDEADNYDLAEDEYITIQAERRGGEVMVMKDINESLMFYSELSRLSAAYRRAGLKADEETLRREERRLQKAQGLEAVPMGRAELLWYALPKSERDRVFAAAFEHVHRDETGEEYRARHNRLVEEAWARL